jgi:predicted RNA-binding Zn ribbon-like protein
MSGRADPFDWSGGHPALDLVNTLDERPSASPVEHLERYADLVTFVELAGLIEPGVAGPLRQLDERVSSRVAGRARALREHLHGILAAEHLGRPVRAVDLDAVSAAILAAHAARHLVASLTPRLAGYQWAKGSAREIPLHACSIAVEHLLVNEDRSRIRKCGAADCAVYYLDSSKGQLRQWCSMKSCGNREKQKRWRSLPRSR